MDIFVTIRLSCLVSGSVRYAVNLKAKKNINVTFLSETLLPNISREREKKGSLKNVLSILPTRWSFVPKIGNRLYHIRFSFFFFQFHFIYQLADLGIEKNML